MLRLLGDLLGQRPHLRVCLDGGHAFSDDALLVLSDLFEVVADIGRGGHDLRAQNVGLAVVGAQTHLRRVDGQVVPSDLTQSLVQLAQRRGRSDVGLGHVRQRRSVEQHDVGRHLGDRHGVAGKDPLSRGDDVVEAARSGEHRGQVRVDLILAQRLAVEAVDGDAELDEGVGDGDARQRGHVDDDATHGVVGDDVADGVAQGMLADPTVRDHHEELIADRVFGWSDLLAQLGGAGRACLGRRLFVLLRHRVVPSSM